MNTRWRKLQVFSSRGRETSWKFAAFMSRTFFSVTASIMSKIVCQNWKHAFSSVWRLLHNGLFVPTSGTSMKRYASISGTAFLNAVRILGSLESPSSANWCIWFSEPRNIPVWKFGQKMSRLYYKLDEGSMVFGQWIFGLYRSNKRCLDCL